MFRNALAWHSIYSDNFVVSRDNLKRPGNVDLALTCNGHGTIIPLSEIKNIRFHHSVCDVVCQRGKTWARFVVHVVFSMCLSIYFLMAGGQYTLN